MDGQPQDVVLIIADISGYTRFMLANRTELVHGQGIISDLLRAVIAEVRIPLTIEKLEGDAIFMVAERTPACDWPGICTTIGRLLPRFVEAFDNRLRTLANDNICRCQACLKMNLLALKVIGHVGSALRYRIGRFDELSGTDVIAVHRLLKNHLTVNRYLLLSAQAFTALQPPGDWSAGTEDLEGLGPQAIHWHTLAAPVPSVPVRRFSLTDMWRKMRYDLAWTFGRRRTPPADPTP